MIDPCIGTTDQACVSVCPVDCIHFDEGTDKMLYINPAECIDCGACQPACPVSAIDLDVLIGLRDHLDERERRLAGVRGVERREPDEAMHPALGAEEAVRVVTLDAHLDGLDADLVARGDREDRSRTARPPRSRWPSTRCATSRR